MSFVTLRGTAKQGDLRDELAGYVSDVLHSHEGKKCVVIIAVEEDGTTNESQRS